MKKLLIALTILLNSVILFSQDLTKYTGLKSKGEIPEEFTKLTTEKIAEAKAQDEHGLEKLNKKTKTSFYEMANFGIDEMLQSGQVCFNDTISSYVENVLEEVREKNHNIPLNIRIYTIKSPVVNAFTTDQGIIFINTGLLAQLENEAQLAFVICHELIHYMENHVREGFVEDVQIERGSSDYRQIRNVDKNLASAKFSRKLESEADVKGLELFLKTDYNPAEIDGVFDVLLYSYLPFDEIPFDSSILEVGDYQIPDKYFLTELNEIEVDENEDDSRHTHPNIKKRREKIDGVLSENNKEGKNFILPKEDFYSVRSAARYEVLRLQLISGNYSEALYSAFILQKEFPENELPKIAIGEILFGTAIFANSNDRKEVVGYYKKMQGNVQQVYFVLSKLKTKEITLLALRYNYYLHELYPEDTFIEKRIVDLCRDLIYYDDFKEGDIIYQKIEAPDAVQTDKEYSKNTITKVTSKYDRIKSSTKKGETDDDFNKDWAEEELFVDCNCEDKINAFFEAGKKEADDKKYRLANTGDNELDAKSKEEQKAYAKMKNKDGRSLGIDKIVMVDPYYVIYKQSSKNNPYKMSKSELEEVDHLEDLDAVSKMVNLDLEILTNYKFQSEDVSKFNDFSLLNEWIRERYLMAGNTNMVSSTEEVSGLVDRYGTKYFAWTGVVYLTSPRRGKIGVMLGSLYTIIGIPYGIYYLATPKKSTIIYFALFNIETGELVMYEDREMHMKDYDGLLMSNYYDIFNQIKK